VKPNAFPLALVLGCSGAALLVLLSTVIFVVRHHRGKYRVEPKRPEAQKKKETELEMEVLEPGNDITVTPEVNNILHIVHMARIIGITLNLILIQVDVTVNPEFNMFYT